MTLTNGGPRDACTIHLCDFFFLQKMDPNEEIQTRHSSQGSFYIPIINIDPPPYALHTNMSMLKELQEATAGS